MSGNKLLVICGPTAVGKTALALHLAKIFNGELLSADSRQVYRGMDIVTGKDLPKDGTKIWLTDLVDPKDEYSVNQWRGEAVSVMREVRERGKLPIVVGGTGFYIKALLDGIETIDISRNEKLRATLVGKSTDELFAILAQLDSVRAANMNQSDRKNPRRLVRAIEVARCPSVLSSGLRLRGSDSRRSKEKGAMRELRGIGGVKSGEYNILQIGLRAPWELLRRRIEKRVEKMMREGALEEVKQLVGSGVAWDAQSMSSIGYQKFRDYFEGKITLSDVKEKWVQGDLQYAKRQMTWVKRNKRIQWFDITRPRWQEKLEKKVLDWYNSGSTNAHD